MFGSPGWRVACPFGRAASGLAFMGWCVVRAQGRASGSGIHGLPKHRHALELPDSQLHAGEVTQVYPGLPGLTPFTLVCPGLPTYPTTLDQTCRGNGTKS
eukprot:366287-Chlamydomonas_euryale.AAC.4